jgi:hypothetical protein
MHERTRLRGNTHGLTSQMYLPSKQDNIGINVIIVILKASYRRARHDLFHGLNDGLFKSILTARRREKQVKGKRWISSEKITQKGRNHILTGRCEGVQDRTSQPLAFNTSSRTSSSSRSTSGSSSDLKVSLAISQSTTTAPLGVAFFKRLDMFVGTTKGQYSPLSRLYEPE